MPGIGAVPSADVVPVLPLDALARNFTNHLGVLPEVIAQAVHVRRNLVSCEALVGLPLHESVFELLYDRLFGSIRFHGHHAVELVAQSHELLPDVLRPLPADWVALETLLWFERPQQLHFLGPHQAGIANLQRTLRIIPEVE